MIEQPPRCGNDDVDTSNELLLLRINTHPTKYDCRANIKITAVVPNTLVYLCSEFARRGQYQYFWVTLLLSVWVLILQLLQQGEGKAGGLTRAGLSTGE